MWRCAIPGMEVRDITVGIAKLEERAERFSQTEGGNFVAKVAFGVEFEALHANADGRGSKVVTHGDLLENLRSRGLTGLNVRIIERIHIEQRTRKGDGDFPFEELDAKLLKSGI